MPGRFDYAGVPCSRSSSNGKVILFEKQTGSGGKETSIMADIVYGAKNAVCGEGSVFELLDDGYGGFIQDAENKRRVFFSGDVLRDKKAAEAVAVGCHPAEESGVDVGMRVRYLAVPQKPHLKSLWRAVWVLRLIPAFPRPVPIEKMLLVEEGEDQAIFWSRRLGHVSFERSLTRYTNRSRFKKDFHVGLWMDVLPVPEIQNPDAADRIQWRAVHVDRCTGNYGGPALEYQRLGAGGLQLLPDAIVTHTHGNVVLFWSNHFGRVFVHQNPINGKHVSNWPDDLEPGDVWRLTTEHEVEYLEYSSFWKGVLKKRLPDNEAGYILQTQEWQDVRARLLWVERRRALLQTEDGDVIEMLDYDYWQQVADFEQELLSVNRFVVTVVAAPLVSGLQWEVVVVHPEGVRRRRYSSARAVSLYESEDMRSSASSLPPMGDDELVESGPGLSPCDSPPLLSQQGFGNAGPVHGDNSTAPSADEEDVRIQGPTEFKAVARGAWTSLTSLHDKVAESDCWKPSPNHEHFMFVSRNLDVIVDTRAAHVGPLAAVPTLEAPRDPSADSGQGRVYVYDDYGWSTDEEDGGGGDHHHHNEPDLNQAVSGAQSHPTVRDVAVQTEQTIWEWAVERLEQDPQLSALLHHRFASFF